MVVCYTNYAQTPFPTGIKLPNATEKSPSLDSIRILTLNENGVVNGWINKDSIGGNVDLSNYYTKLETEETISDSISTLIKSIQEGDNISIDNTDPQNPIISVDDIEQQFVQITEAGKTGWGLKHRVDNAGAYGNIGNYAIDLSYNIEAFGTDFGAVGNYSFVAGTRNTASAPWSSILGGNSNLASAQRASIAGGSSNTASGAYSFVFGNENTASGNYSTTGGSGNIADTYAETVIGRYSSQSGGDPASWVTTDRLFNIGNGLGSEVRSDAFTILKNGLATLPSVTNTLIDTEPTGKAVITREWFEGKVDSFIPLTGTEEGKPFTGTLAFGNATSRISRSNGNWVSNIYPNSNSSIAGGSASFSGIATVIQHKGIEGTEAEGNLSQIFIGRYSSGEPQMALEVIDSSGNVGSIHMGTGSEILIGRAVGDSHHNILMNDSGIHVQDENNPGGSYFLPTQPTHIVSKKYVDDLFSSGGSGSVTSVGMSVPTGLTISGSPITTSGTLSLGYASGYQGYTTTESNKLSGIQANAEVNVNSDWSASSGDAQILNKPTTISGFGITDAQPLDATLTGIASLTPTTNQMIYATGTDTFSTVTSSAGGRALLNATGTANTIPYYSASNTVGALGTTTGGRALLNNAGTANTFPYYSAPNTVSLGSITAFGRSLIDDADAATARTTLGVPEQVNLIGGTNIDITGTYPNLTINSSAGAMTAGEGIDITSNVISLDPFTETTLGGVKVWSGTQSEYDAISTYNEETLYFVETNPVSEIAVFTVDTEHTISSDSSFSLSVSSAISSTIWNRTYDWDITWKDASGLHNLRDYQYAVLNQIYFASRNGSGDFDLSVDWRAGSVTIPVGAKITLHLNNDAPTFSE